MDVSQLREQFPITRKYIFLNAAAVAPMCRPAAEAVRRYVDHTLEHANIGADFYLTAEKARLSAARLINATADEITFVKNTTEGLGWVATGLPLGARATTW